MTDTERRPRSHLLRVVGTMATALLIAASNGAAQTPQENLIAAELEALKAELKVANNLISVLLDVMPKRMVEIDCNSPGYREVRATSGEYTLLVSCEKIEPYLEGHKIFLKIGNPYSMEINRLTGSIGYGATSVAAYGSKNRTKFRETRDFKPGTWQEVTVTINPSPAKELRVLTIDVDVESLSLMSR